MCCTVLCVSVLPVCCLQELCVSCALQEVDFGFQTSMPSQGGWLWYWCFFCIFYRSCPHSSKKLGVVLKATVEELTEDSAYLQRKTEKGG